jgi:hypothetical protein
VEAGGDEEGSSWGVGEEEVWGEGIRIVALTQATHSYYRFVRGLAESLETHLASPQKRPTKIQKRRTKTQKRPSQTQKRPSKTTSVPRLHVRLVVFTDNVDEAQVIY